MTGLPPTHSHLKLTEVHPDLEPYSAELEQVMEPAWLLNAYSVDSVSRAETHFLGTNPYVPVSEAWPRCKQCGQMLEFVCQINFTEFAGSGMFSDRGLFQFFYCWKCFPITHKEIARGEALTTRWYPQFNGDDAETTEYAEFVAADGGGVYDPTPMCVRPTPFLSFPDMFNSDHLLASIDLDLDEGPDEDEFAVQLSFLPMGDYISQLGGYPLWVQSDETPVCLVCGRQAELVGAIGSDDTQLVWGDSGYWYFFACKATDACHGLAKPLVLFQCH